MKFKKIITSLLTTLILVGCNDLKENDQKDIQNESHTNVKIINHYSKKPQSIHKDNTLILNGVLNGEFIEVIVEGEIFDFELIELEWDNEKNDIVEKEVTNRIDAVRNQSVIIKTYMVEGIPREKIRWKSKSGEVYEFNILQSGIGKPEWEFDIE